MGKESIKANYRRVYEIYGIDPDDPRYNIHHIVFKRDVKKGLINDFNVNKISNLIPLLRRDHTELHRKVDDMEHYSMPVHRKHHRKHR